MLMYRLGGRGRDIGNNRRLGAVDQEDRRKQSNSDGERQGKGKRQRDQDRERDWKRPGEAERNQGREKRR